MPTRKIQRIIPSLVVTPLLISLGAITGLAIYNGRQTIDRLSKQLADRIGDRVEARVNRYLDMPHPIHAINHEKVTQLGEQDLQTLEGHFWHQLQLFEITNAVYFGDTRGNAVGAKRSQDNQLRILRETGEYTANPRGERAALVPEAVKMDPRQQHWYEAARDSRRATWSNITRDEATGKLEIASVYPVYDDDDRPIGVLGVELFVSEIDDFLSQIEVSQTGQAFIIDRNGRLIASSTDQPISSDRALRLSALNSQDPLMRATMEYLIAEFGALTQIEQNRQNSFIFQNQRYFVQVRPFRDDYGLDWLIAITIPETDFIQQVNAHARTTVLVGGLLVAATTLLGFLMSRWLVQPISRLSEATEQLKTHEFEPESLEDLTRRSDEIGSFARVFQQMAMAIGTRKQSLEDRLRDRNLQANRAVNIPLQDLRQLKAWQKKAKLIREASTYPVDLTRALPRIPYFQNFSDREIQQLIDAGYQTTIEPGAFICREGEPGNEFYMISSGSVRIFVEKINKHLVDLGEGDSFGELALLLGIPRTATAIAKEETVLFVLDRQNLSVLLQAYPAIGDRIAQQLEEHQAELTQRKAFLAECGLLDEDFSHSPMTWIKKRMGQLFGV